MSKFKRNLKKGKKYEQLALSYFDYEKVYYPDGNFKDYDFIIDDNIKVEVKSDIQASFTGNLCIEYECNNKPSGISSTSADYWIYFINYKDHDECYKIPLKELIDICHKKGRKVSGGDGGRSRCFLIKKDIFKDYIIYKKVKIKSKSRAKKEEIEIMEILH